MGSFVTLDDGADVVEGGLAKFKVGTEKIAVANVAGTLYAFGDVCTHRGCSLAKGKLHGTEVTCPCHGSVFDVTTGAVVKGPATVPVKAYPIRRESGDLRVEI
jgi:nitrite reductase/ring-hydroxylating ferredoxin subunit